MMPCITPLKPAATASEQLVQATRSQGCGESKGQLHMQLSQALIACLHPTTMPGSYCRVLCHFHIQQPVTSTATNIPK